MTHVAIPITSLDWAKDLTPDQRNLLVILEDATLMYVRDEIQFLRSLPEIMHGSKLTDSYCVDALSVIERRMKQIRRGWGKEKTEQYEAALLEAVDGCDTERADLKREIRAALVQKVRWQDIDRAEHIATAEAVLALIMLIQLRNAYNGDWVPEWKEESDKFIIGFHNGHIETWSTATTARILCFKTEELRDEFLRNFRPLIEELKPLYGIKEGGEE